jgi:steroid delta-isomerase-like uncharacterized protein
VSIVREFERAFNRQDVEALVACFTPTGTYRDNFFGDHAGSAGLREMFARMFREGRDYVWHMDAVVETPERAAAEWTFSYVVTEAVPRSAGRKVRFRGMSLFELEGGRVARYREYFDTGAALLQLGFARSPSRRSSPSESEAFSNRRVDGRRYRVTATSSEAIPSSLTAINIE